MGEAKYRIIQDPVWKYRRLDPVPAEEEVTEFYQRYYYELVRRGGRAPGLRRLTSENTPEAEAEASWLHATLYTDIVAVLEEHSPPSRYLLDVGCGTGEFVAFVQKNGWKAVGVEPSEQAAAVARGRGLEVHNSSIEEVAAHPECKANFGVVSLLNVLEHVPDPVKLLCAVKRLLVPGGLVVIQVPNDFNELQLAAAQQLDREPWWVAIPDHINYFDFPSLGTLLAKNGFQVVYAQSDFPMEWFLLMGDDYVDNAEVGSRCHHKRVCFEMNIPSELRRRIYRAFAKLRIGRQCLVFGRKSA